MLLRTSSAPLLHPPQRHGGVTFGARLRSSQSENGFAGLGTTKNSISMAHRESLAMPPVISHHHRYLSDMACDLGNNSSGGRRHGGGTNPSGNYHGGHMPDSTENYYRKLLQAEPENPLLLRNFAQYLNEVKGDHIRSEQLFERAILASPAEGETLSQYAKLQWDMHRDSERAETYFSQAVQAAADDCYVLAAYASFLWDSEEAIDGKHCTHGIAY